MNDIDIDIAKYQHEIDLADSLIRLENNKDFQFIITNNLFNDIKNENILSLNACKKDSYSEELIFKSIYAISYLQSYFKKIKDNKENNKEYLDKLLAMRNTL